MTFKNTIKSIWFQLKHKNAFENIFITHNAFGIFHINSHINSHTGNDKVVYNTEKTAKKVVEEMSKKNGVHFSYYKCAFCDGYHVGKNKQNKN